ncbi:MAG TPA: hypothetical protein PKL08_14500, partial [Thermoanaerobaculaceae bacterium]|nr:hypothetical protein [Thermoanaerobaculaceae bacterium]
PAADAPAPGPRDQPGNDVEKGTLARSRPAEHAHDLTWSQLEVEVPKNRLRPPRQPGREVSSQ